MLTSDPTTSSETGTSCWATYGASSPTTVNLPTGCKTIGKAVHEVMHALAFEHEHNRWDRDYYVTILEDNILPDHLDSYEIQVGNYCLVP